MTLHSKLTSIPANFAAILEEDMQICRLSATMATPLAPPLAFHGMHRVSALWFWILKNFMLAAGVCPE